jgi:hypothetical protein
MSAYNVQALLPNNFPASARVWVYQSSRPLSEKEVIEINEQLEQFYTQWQAHSVPVKGWAKVLFQRFIVLMADEAVTAVSGCSTDASVRVIKSIERQYDINLFDRLSLTFLVKEKPEMLPLNQVQYALDKGYINGDTLLFNNVVDTKEALETLWLQPLRNSWLKDRVQIPQNS